MYVEDSTRRVMTFQRPRVNRVTVGLPRTHHLLEDILAKPSVRRALVWATRRDTEDKCFFMRLCENYANPDLDFSTRLRWVLPSLLIDLGLRKAKLDKAVMLEKLFHHPPTVKALALTAKSIGTYGLTVPQRFAAPLFVVWNVTQACNLTCVHCYQDAKRRPDSDELTTEEKLDLIDQMASEFVPFLAFAGGEPLMTPNFGRVLEHCQNRGIHVTLATNGVMLTPETCARLRDANVKYIEVSIDSLDPKEHDQFRGQRGAWARATQGIRNSVAAGIRTGMACCFTRETVHKADDMVRFAIDLGCQTFSHFNFIPVGRGKGITDSDLTPGQRELLMRQLQRHLAGGNINVISTAPQFGRSCIAYGAQDGMFATGHAGRGQGQKTLVLSRYIGGCGAGRCYCCVQPNGIITPCVYIGSEKVGDIRQQSLKEIWNNPLFDVLADREDRSDHCGVCDYRSYCGGCRARALAYTDDIQAGDPGCVYNQHVWDEIAQETGSLVASDTLPQDGKDGGNGKGTLTNDTGRLVQIMAVGSVEAAQMKDLAGLADEDVREIKGIAQQLKDLQSRPN